MADAVKTTHPVRGFIWGLLMGIGLALILVLTTVIELAPVTMVVVIVICALLGVVWGLYGPAKSAGAPPAGATVEPEAEPEPPADPPPATDDPVSEPG